MKLRDLFKYNRERFSAKIFFLFTVFFVALYFAFTTFFIYYQSKALKDNLIHDGEAYVNHLAYNSRLGVFAENRDLLRDPVEGFMQSSEVISVQVFTLDGKELKKMKRSDNRFFTEHSEMNEDWKEKTIDSIKKSKSVFYFEGDNRIEFWAPVISGRDYFREETLYFSDAAADKKDNMIGFVRIVITTELLNASIRAILMKSILIMAFFMGLGWIVIRFIVSGITRPLDRLTKSVIAMGEGDSVEEVAIETEDEIGKLGLAFNNMIASLRKMDIEKRKIEEQLRHAQKMEAIGTLAGGIAHDFNNTLSTIMGYGQLLEKKIDDEATHKYLDHMLSSAKKAGIFIQSLLAFSRKEVSNPESKSLNDIIINLEHILQRLLGEDIELHIKLSGEDMVIMTETGQIDQLLINLASNARDAMPDEGRLTIITKSTELDRKFYISSDFDRGKRYAMISVEDTGMGMDGETKERIFDPFFTTKEVGRGTGLGLSMVYGIVKQHNGFVDVTSKIGQGTTFKIYLPLSSSAVKEKENVLSVPKSGTETVLVAEDNDDFRRVIRIVLEQKGYNVIEAVNGSDAVEKFIENRDKIKFLMLDVIMPKKNGKEVYEEIKRIQSDIDVLFVSGYSASELEEKECYEEGVEILAKPLLADDLIARMREILDGRVMQ